MAILSEQQNTAPKREVKWNDLDHPSIPGVTHGILHSASMDRDVGYNVALPPGYDDSNRRYPVVYFLHGAGGTESSDAGGFSALVQKEIAAKRIPPVICVFPNGGMSGYRDHPETKVMVETMLIQELMPLIEQKYRTIASAEGRAICGFSMGGGGAMRLAVKYPNLFSAGASWAASFGRSNDSTSAAALVKENAEKIRGHVRLLCIVGDKDFTQGSHPAFLDALKDAKLPVEYRVLPGVDHNLGAYYEQTGMELVDFVTAGFTDVK